MPENYTVDKIGGQYKFLEILLPPFFIGKLRV